VKALTANSVTRLEKAAVDNGFDKPLSHDDIWLGFGSTHAPLRVWLCATADAAYVAALSQLNVIDALGEHGMPTVKPVPMGAAAARVVADVPALNRLLRRAFQLSKTLPNELLTTFQQQTAALPKATEAERLVVQRVGQEVFRKGLLEYWEGRCAITGLAVPALLRASHVKPWADCASDAERLDVFNGLLLAPHLDAVFDRGFITVGDDGTVVVGAGLDGESRRLLGLDAPLRVHTLHDGHRQYLPWHRERVFRSEG
jgi:putative restriction endonuclease